MQRVDEMAQNKSMLDRLSLGNVVQTDFVKVSYQGSRFRFFWETLKFKFGKFVKTNFFGLIFFVPIIAVLVYFFLLKQQFGIRLPFNANVGIGYPPSTVDLMGEYKTLVFVSDLQQFALYVPLSMIAFGGLAGVFRVLKVFSWDRTPDSISIEFFAGIKQNFVKFVFFGLLFGVALFVLFVSISALQNFQLNVFVAIFGFIAVLIVSVFLFSACMFACTQSVTFKISFWRAVGNGFAFSGGLFLLNLIMAILALGPLVLIMILFIALPTLGVVFIFPLLFFALVYVAFVYTMYSHFLYERFLFSKVVREAKVVEAKGDEVQEAQPKPKEQKKPNVVKPVKYTKNKSSNADFGSMFGRKDLDDDSDS